jgi:hypothetical protein
MLTSTSAALTILRYVLVKPSFPRNGVVGNFALAGTRELDLSVEIM